MQMSIPKKTELSAMVKILYAQNFDPASISFACEWRDLVVLGNGFEGGCRCGNFFVLN
jgi:hypothetical protein